MEMPGSFGGNKHEKVAFDNFEHGIIKRRLLVGQDEESDDWKIGHPLVFPYKMWVGGNGVYQMQIRVPVDDTHTNVIFYTIHAPDGAELPDEVHTVDYPIEWQNDDGTYIVDYIEGQDIMAWVSQGHVAEPHDAIKLPLERSKFGRGAEFASDWIDNGSMKFSPIAQEMKQLHIDAAKAREGMANT